MIRFNSNLIFLRNNKRLTLQQLSKDLGFTTSQWSNYENGRSYPKFLDLIKISKYFNISETDLIHKDLQIDFFSNKDLNPKSTNEIIELQYKIIRLQEEKIIELTNNQ